jgi:hypothetical protein
MQPFELAAILAEPHDRRKITSDFRHIGPPIENAGPESIDESLKKCSLFVLEMISR